MSSNSDTSYPPKANNSPTIGLAESTPQSSRTSTDPTSTVTTSGSIVQSSDPSIRADASLAQKLTGNVKGAVSGTVGSLQAATGAAIRNKGMEEKGLEKMAEEDQRLGSKRGVMPVGSGQRETEVDEDRIKSGTEKRKVV